MFPLVAMALWCLLRAAGCSSSCEEARLKCAYRTGCGMALQNYIVGCSAVLHGPGTSCPETCQHALIALTSTEEGKDLMTCSCTDEFCEESKRKVEICRPHVLLATQNETVVTCRIAQWICAADALCSTALDYYNRFCRAMFQGKKCTHRCNNSISILRRQEKAAKLNSCRCDGREEYDCPRIRTNMARLCFHREPPPPEPPEPEAPGVPPASGAPAVHCLVLVQLIAVLLRWVPVT
ncbi:growth arrest-specific protein 1-like [Periplaneta americana]|uniref:growth arrest-specific protein 1-like n=1 Tax=Periplaneta americana TaxID=6978 RepID=UPI0037E987EB